MTEAIESLRKQVQALADDVARNAAFHADVKEMKGAVGRLAETIKGLDQAIRGDDPLGGRSLAVRINSIETVANGAASKATDVGVRVAVLEKVREESATEERRNKTAVVVAVVAAVGSIVAAVVALVAANWHHIP